MAEYATVAYNIVNHGRFDRRSPGDGPARTYMNREPGYPAYLAAAFATVPGFSALSPDCLRNDDCAAADAARLRHEQAAAVLAAVLVAATFVAACFATGQWLPAALAGLLCLLFLPLEFSGSRLIALFLLGHSVLAFAVWRRPRVVTGVLAGIALGLLVLIEAVFQYWLAILPLVCAVGLWRDAERRRSHLLPVAAMLIAALASSLPWMVRNAVHAGEFSVASGGGEILAIRAEYGRMTWPEVLGAFAYHMPVGGKRDRAAVRRWLEPEEFSYSRFDRGNPEGFYRRSKNNTGDVAARMGEDRIATGRTRDQAKKRAALEMIGEDWIKHVVLTFAFAENGLKIWFNNFTALKDRYGEDTWRIFQFRSSYYLPVGVLFISALGFMLVLSWRRRDLALFFLLLPVTYSFFFHAALTHFLPRYSRPFVPVLAIAFALAAKEVWAFRGRPSRRRRELRAGPARASHSPASAVDRPPRPG